MTPSSNIVTNTNNKMGEKYYAVEQFQNPKEFKIHAYIFMRMCNVIKELSNGSMTCLVFQHHVFTCRRTQWTLWVCIPKRWTLKVTNTTYFIPANVNLIYF